MNISYSNNFRWIVIVLLFSATTINYMDRIVISVLLPEIRLEISINSIIYGFIVSAFQFSYTIGLLVAGFVIDRFGTKFGYLLSMILWSFAGGMHGLAGTGFSLAACQGIFGFTAAGNFPSAIKSVSEWFKVEDRAFATSVFNSGASISSIIGPPLIAVIALSAGWRWSFIFFGALGLILAFFWQKFYKNPVVATIKNTKPTKKIKWSVLIQNKSALGIMLGKFLTDPVWWFYLYWMPTYLNDQRGFDLKAIALAIPVIYTIATLIGFVGGWFPGFLMKKGWSTGRARRFAMLLSASLLPVTSLAVLSHSPWTAILLVSLACGAHNSWSANIFTMSSDCFSSETVGSVTGLAGFAGGIGGIILSALVPGFVIHYFGYIPVFILMGILHPLGYISVSTLVKYKES